MERGGALSYVLRCPHLVSPPQTVPARFRQRQVESPFRYPSRIMTTPANPSSAIGRRFIVAKPPYPGDWEIKPGLIVECIQAPMNHDDELLIRFMCPVI